MRDLYAKQSSKAIFDLRNYTSLCPIPYFHTFYGGMATFRTGTMLIFVGIDVAKDIIVVKACGLDMECFFLLFLLDFNDRIKKVLSKPINLVHLAIKNK